MNQNKLTCEALINHCKNYPLLSPKDTFKFLYQSVFGCEHMISSPEFVIENIRKEFASAEKNEKIIEFLDGNYCRVNLEILNQGLSAETLGKLFFLSAKKKKGNIDNLKSKLSVLKDLVQSGKLPFSSEEFFKSLKIWEEQNFPLVHHSDAFRKNYRPAYRVISNEYVKFLPLLCKIDKMQKEKRVILAIEGGSASGKTTLGNILKNIYDCNIFHMDDFFLQPHQRTNVRLNTPGGNVDRERFLKEILIPLNSNRQISYKKFDCSSGVLKKARTVIPKRINIIEGAYSMHPALKKHYNISVFLDISPELQKHRILKRNPEKADKFFNVWIPLEQKYFKTFDIKNNCNFVISADGRDVSDAVWYFASLKINTTGAELVVNVGNTIQLYPIIPEDK